MGVVDPFSVARAAGLELIGKSEGLTLTDGTMELRADFDRMLPRLKQGCLQQELLVKAARAKGIECPWAIDATAGFGEDSLLLAAAGFTVDLYEQDCVIAALLKDALDRAGRACRPRRGISGSHVSRTHQERGGEKEVPTLAPSGAAVRR